MAGPTSSYPFDYHRVGKSNVPGTVNTELGLYETSKQFNDYMALISDPFTGPLVGIPTGSPAASQQYRSIFEVEITTGTQGFGFIAWSPVTAASMFLGCATTTGAYTGTTIVDNVAAGPFAGCTNLVTSQFPYGKNDHTKPALAGGTTSVVSRVVAASMRYVNTTETVGIGGRARCGQTQFGIATGQGFSNQQDLACGNAWQHGADSDLHELRWQTTHTADLEYNEWDVSSYERACPFSVSASAVGADHPLPVCYLMIQAPKPSIPQTYTVQICIVAEYAGYVNTGLPITNIPKRLADPSMVQRIRHMVEHSAPDKGIVAAPKQQKDDWISWLTRQGDRLLNIAFDRPVTDPTGRESGTTLRLLRDIGGAVYAARSGNKAQAGTPRSIKGAKPGVLLLKR